MLNDCVYLCDVCHCVEALFVEAKLEASKELSQYIDQLNVSLEEKRVVFQMARKGLSSESRDSSIYRPPTTLSN